MRRLIATITIAIGLIIPGAAWADEITYSTHFFVSGDYANHVAGVFSVPFDSIQFLALPRFNGPGTLQGVEISFESESYASLLAGAFDNREEADFVLYPPFVVNERNDTYVEATVAGSVRIQLFDPSSSSITLTLPSVHVNCSAHNSSGADVACQAPYMFEQSTLNGMLPIGGLGVSPFIGTDQIDLYVQLLGSLSGLCDSDDRGDDCYVDPSGIGLTGNLRVKYTYSTDADGGSTGGGGDAAAVPEPSTLTLLGVVLAGLIARRVRPRAAQRA